MWLTVILTEIDSHNFGSQLFLKTLNFFGVYPRHWQDPLMWVDHLLNRFGTKNVLQSLSWQLRTAAILVLYTYTVTKAEPHQPQYFHRHSIDLRKFWEHYRTDRYTKMNQWKENLRPDTALLGYTPRGTYDTVEQWTLESGLPFLIRQLFQWPLASLILRREWKIHLDAFSVTEWCYVEQHYDIPSA